MLAQRFPVSWQHELYRAYPKSVNEFPGITLGILGMLIGIGTSGVSAEIPGAPSTMRGTRKPRQRSSPPSRLAPGGHGEEFWGATVGMIRLAREESPDFATDMLENGGVGGLF